MERKNTDLGLDAFLIALDHSPRELLDIKTLRLVCKSVKVAADSRIYSLKIYMGEVHGASVSPGIPLLAWVRDLTVFNDEVHEGDPHYLDDIGLASLSHDIATGCAQKLESLCLSIKFVPSRRFILTPALANVDWPCLTSIKFDAIFSSNNETYDFLRRMPALTAVSCIGVDTAAALSAIADALEGVKPNLTYMCIGFRFMNDISAEGARAAFTGLLSGASALKELRVCNVDRSAESIIDFDLEVFKSIESLAFYMHMATFKNLATLPKHRLRSLSFHDNAIVAGTIFNTSSFPALEELRFKGALWDPIAPLHLPTLIKLKIEDVQIPLDKMNAFFNCLGSLKSLEELTYYPSLYDWRWFDGNAALAALFSSEFELASMKSLKLKFYDLSPQSMEDLAMTHWRCCPNLTDLSIDIHSSTAVDTLVGGGLAGAWPNLRSITAFNERPHRVPSGSDESEGSDSKSDDLPFSVAWAEGALRRAWPGVTFELGIVSDKDDFFIRL